jgi:hypothetical protein
MYFPGGYGEGVPVPLPINVAYVQEAVGDDGDDNLALAGFAMAIWARESGLYLRPDGDHGPLQLTSAVGKYYPKVKIEEGAYDKFPRPKDHPNRKRVFTGNILANIKTGVNLFRWRMENEPTNYYGLAYGYGPGKGREGESEAVARDNYAQATLRVAALNYKSLRCLRDCG